MVYKPGDYFVGVVDFFAILMPGALFSFLLLRLASEYHFGPILPKAWGAAEHWVAFIFASYLLGHFISLLGANLDGIYDRTYRKYKRRKGDKLLAYVEKVKKEKYLGNDKDITNTIGWASAVVRLRSPVAATEIDRVEADSKFFRSLTFVFILMCGLSVCQGWHALVVFLGLGLLSFWRYCQQRWKRTRLTYEFFAALEKLPKSELG